MEYSLKHEHSLLYSSIARACQSVGFSYSIILGGPAGTVRYDDQACSDYEDEGEQRKEDNHKESDDTGDEECGLCKEDQRYQREEREHCQKDHDEGSESCQEDHGKEGDEGKRCYCLSDAS